ncbi:Bug family tripartite tricarboxylate transporter substrate binding protein [Candidimonas nitroreducens]|uniref:ABC transporter substrate-binding protein n=1 Tax=Candidimonas nitroreducens TaxID=683354 RepID=A0A225MMV5_9BURK|nr:tripartite tricarboxylate transporter substrate binding protein [Candidimonas nitroreducens]OWT61693.1 ABC transporter substrate-binding protein [Candidimonas nitroreducens]
MTKISLILRALGVAALLTSATPSIAQTSEAPIRIVVPYSPGGTTDMLARFIASSLQAKTKRPVIVDNRSGAGGEIGTAAVVQARPDGNTLLFHSGAIAVYPSIQKKLPFDVTKDLTPITTAVGGPFAVIVNKDFPAKTLHDLIAMAKASPGSLNFGSAGVGTSTHLAGELLVQEAGIKMTHIPYRGGSDASLALLGGQVQFAILTVGESVKLVKSGKLRALAVTTLKRSDILPNVPTVAESGLPGFDASVLFTLFVSSKTPAPIAKRLNEDLVAVLRDPSMARKLKDLGLSPIGDTLDQAHERFDSEIRRWGTVIKKAGIHLE